MKNWIAERYPDAKYWIAAVLIAAPVAVAAVETTKTAVEYRNDKN